MVESAGLENRNTLRGIEGSNPSLSAVQPHYVVYILYSISLDRTYTGHTDNVEKRLKQHNAGKTRSTGSGRPWRVIFTEACKDREEARHREKWFKSSSGRKRIAEILKEWKGEQS